MASNKIFGLDPLLVTGGFAVLAGGAIYWFILKDMIYQPPPAGVTHNVAIKQMTGVGTVFDPADVTVKVGDTIVWMNQSPSVHDVTNGYHPPSEDPYHGTVFTQMLQPLQTFSWKVTKPAIVESAYGGIMPYHCHLDEGAHAGTIHYSL